MEFLLYIYKYIYIKEDGLFMQKKEKKSFTTIQHICNMCVFQYACIVYINFAPPKSNPDFATAYK